MVDNPNKLSRFWQELKRRKVVRVITVYAAAAFAILEVVSIIVEPLRLPEWTLPFIIVLLCVGFIIAVILSWIYDIHPEGGIVKTEPSNKVKEDVTKPSNSWRIASYISFVVIVVLIALNIFGGRNRVTIDESLAKSIAVLPFQNFSTDPNQESMCLGLTDEIINHLYRIESFEKVVSLTSVLGYRMPNKTVSEIATELGVNYILEGVYKKIDDELFVSAQLIEPMNDSHIWQQDYKRPYTDIMNIQSDIAIQIADHINAFITKEDVERIKKIPTSNQEAYEIVQQYLMNWKEGNMIMIVTGLEQATRAIELDPTYADAHAMKGMALLLGKGIMFGKRFTQSDLIDAKRAIDRAIDLDNESSLAHVAQATFLHFIEWDYVKAETEYRNSIRLAKGKPFSFAGYFLLLQQMNRPEDAFSYSEEIVDWWKGQALRCFVTAGKDEELVDILINRIGKFNLIPASYKGELYLWLGENDSALSCMDIARSESDELFNTNQSQSAYATALYLNGNTASGEHVINQMKKSSQITTSGSPNFNVGAFYSWIGQKDSAFYWLEKAYDAREPGVPWLKVHPAFEILKDDPRYWDLYERTGHKAYDDFMASKNN